MTTSQELKSYAGMLGFKDSTALGRILAAIYDTPMKQQLIGLLPGTLKELSAKSDFDAREMEAALKELRAVGGCFYKADRNGKYDLYRGVIEFRDAVLLTPDIELEMVELFRQVVWDEMPGIIPELEKGGVPPMMRVIPIEETVENKSAVLDFDSARKLLQGADRIAIIPCVCRISTQRLDLSPDCPAPEDVNLCMQVNRFADESLERGYGEEVTIDEAIRRLEIAEEAGLVHLTRNNIKTDFSLCNCCACCCTGLYFINEIKYDALAPSRFLAKVDEVLCTACETCVDRCQFHAIDVDDVAVINPDTCFGCGVCVSTCPAEAIILEESRPRDFVRVT